ncbi:MAG: flagellar biosynthesis regulator FlaF [Alphaproteobacteria bacterium]|nr:flagellar biosynthesis regulator FlaF [Alphaproteobacteria bacterium]
MSLQAYQRTQRTVESPRDAEYRLFGQVTRALLDAAALPRTDRRVIDAIDWNRRMWSAFANDCASPENQLLPSLRGQIISLSLWVARYSSQVMRENADMMPLVDINRLIMQGLERRG